MTNLSTTPFKATDKSAPAKALYNLLVALCKSGKHSTGKNPYSIPEVEEGLKALLVAAGHKVDGANWLDGLEVYERFLEKVDGGCSCRVCRREMRANG